MWIPFGEESIKKEVSEYDDLSFFKKSKNAYTVFIFAVSALTIGMLLFLGGQNPVGAGAALLSAMANVVFALFIYLNHRWAMIAFALMYTLDKVLFIANGVGFPLSQLIFGAIALYAAYMSFMVATLLKRQAKAGA